MSPIYTTLVKNGDILSPQDYTLKRDNLIEGNGAGFLKRLLKDI